MSVRRKRRRKQDENEDYPELPEGHPWIREGGCQRDVPEAERTCPICYEGAMPKRAKPTLSYSRGSNVLLPTGNGRPTPRSVRRTNTNGRKRAKKRKRKRFTR
jgi:hypothetical protein